MGTRTRRSVAALVAVAAGAVPIVLTGGGPVAAQAAPTKVVVSGADVTDDALVADPCVDTDGSFDETRPWCRVVATDGSSVTLNDDGGPEGGPPEGSGYLSIELESAQGFGVFRTLEQRGQLLSSIDTLAYEVFRDAASGGSANSRPSLNVLVDTDGGDFEADDEVRLFWEPTYADRDRLADGVWQDWVPSDDQGWWSPQNIDPATGRQAGQGVVGTLGFPQFQGTFDQAVAGVTEDNPGATILRIGVSLGQSVNSAGFVGGVDALQVNDTLYDFEAAQPVDETVEVNDGDVTDAALGEGCAAAFPTATSATWCRVEGSVTPGDDSGTAELTETGGPTGERPSGDGYLRIETPDPGSFAVFRTLELRGDPLDSIDFLAYSAFRDGAATGEDFFQPALNIFIDRDGDQQTTNELRLFWEPVYAEGGADAVDTGVWQEWTPSTGRGWWSPSNFGTPGPGPEGPLGFVQYGATLSEVIDALYEDGAEPTIIRLGTSLGNGGAGFVGGIDALQVNGTLYDFEVEEDVVVPPPPPPPPTQPGTLSVADEEVSVGEGADEVDIDVTRSGTNLAGGITVDVDTADGTAEAGEDYTATSETVTFAAGQTTATVTVPILDDDVVEDDETFTVSLSDASGGATIGAADTTTVTIVDDDDEGEPTPPQPRGLDLACPDPSAGAPFPDVPADNVHRTAVACFADEGYVQGYPDGNFRPESPVTRGQSATILARLLADNGVALPANPPDAFPDDQGGVHELATNQLAALGIILGDAAGNFGPDVPVSRAQAVSLIVRTYEVIVGEPLPAGPDYFDDTDGLTQEADIAAAAQAGITAGRGDRSFDPGAGTRRDQAASLFARFADLLVEVQGS